MWLGLLTFLAGAKRWFNKEAAIAVAAVLVVLVAVTGAALLYSSGQSAGGAKEKASWLGKFNAWNLMQAKRKERMAVRALEGEVRARQEAERQLQEAIERAAVHAAALAKLKSDGKDREIITFDERMRYFSK